MHLFSNLQVPHAPNSARVNNYKYPVSCLPKVDHVINQGKRPLPVDLYLPLALWTTEVKIFWKMLLVCVSSCERETRNVTRPGPKTDYIWNEEMVWELASSVTYGGTKFILYFKVMSARDDLQGTIFMVTMLEQHCSKQCSSKVCI